MAPIGQNRLVLFTFKMICGLNGMAADESYDARFSPLIPKGCRCWMEGKPRLHSQYLTFGISKLHYCSHRKTKTSAVPKAQILSTVLKAQSVHPKPVFMHNLPPSRSVRSRRWQIKSGMHCSEKKKGLRCCYVDVTCLMDPDKNGLACNHMIMYEYSSGDT